MDFPQFIDRVITIGVDAKKDYVGSRLRGAIAGFEACRRKQPEELIQVLADARQEVKKHFDCSTDVEVDTYWYWNCFEAEVEWVMNCVSVLLMNQGLPPLMSYLPTAGGVVTASKILSFEDVTS